MLNRITGKHKLMTGGFTVAGRPAELSSIRCPVLALAFENDNIVPLASAAPLVDRIGSVDKQLVVQGGGHVGAVVSRKASTRLWPVMSEFWAKRAWSARVRSGPLGSARVRSGDP